MKMMITQNCKPRPLLLLDSMMLLLLLTYQQQHLPWTTCHAFSPTDYHHQQQQQRRLTRTTATGSSMLTTVSSSSSNSALFMSAPQPPPPPSSSSSSSSSPEGDSIWDQFRKYWDETLGTGASSQSSPEQPLSSQGGGNEIFTIARIQVESIKPGGLRLFLMLYLMGIQNTPQPKTWRAHQPTTVSYYNDDPSNNNNNIDNSNKHVLEMYFQDQSALFRIRLLPTAIVLERQGLQPSTAYLMQETLLVDGIWNELQSIATQTDVPDVNRLLLLPPEAQTTMDQAREALSFG